MKYNISSKKRKEEGKRKKQRKQLLTTPQSENEMQSTLLLDIIIRESPTILELFPSKNQPLLIRWNPFFILNLTFNIVNCIRRFNFKGNSFPRQCFNENLHSTT